MYRTTGVLGLLFCTVQWAKRKSSAEQYVMDWIVEITASIVGQFRLFHVPHLGVGWLPVHGVGRVLPVRRFLAFWQICPT